MSWRNHKIYSETHNFALSLFNFLQSTSAANTVLD